jgi:DNA-binding NtrC family response regulator
MKSILLVVKEKAVFETINDALNPEFIIGEAPDIETALDVLKEKRYDILFIEIEMLADAKQDNGYKKAFRQFWQMYPTLEIVVLSSKEMIREAVKAVKGGASDYLTYPIDAEEIKLIIDTVYDSFIKASELDYLRDRFWDTAWLEIIQTKSALMKAVFEKIRSVAPTRSTVLLTGETGTGKGVLANIIHQHSNRREAQFIAVHCGAIPDTLLESELFGHEKGAFTGAVRRKLGKFEIAKGGTIFLDEIGTITPSAQIKLLQVLQDGSFQRVGGVETLQADVRVIAAANVDLRRMCEDGRFRKDLFFRLNVFPIEVPPLRERVEDIPYFVTEFLKRMNRENQKEIHDIDPPVMDALKHYPWPGNIRELENLIERAYILENSHVLTPESFPGELFQGDVPSASIVVDSSLKLAEVKRKGLEDIERNYLKEILTEHKGKINDSAATAGITTRQLHKLMAKHGLKKEAFKSHFTVSDQKET